jgi:hypothetical protein
MPVLAAGGKLCIADPYEGPMYYESYRDGRLLRGNPSSSAVRRN